MRRSLAAALVWLVVCLAAPTQAGYNEGVAAYERGDYATALREFRSLAAQGYAHAQHNLGVMYENDQGVPQDYAEAVRWYRKAAAQGYARAQNNLGGMYHGGKGVPQDYAEAVRWYRKAAEQGFTEAQDNLGFMFGEGRGVLQDYVQAHMWFNLAATTGNKNAGNNRDAIANRMTPSQIEEAQRLAREWRPKGE